MGVAILEMRKRQDESLQYNLYNFQRIVLYLCGTEMYL